MILIEPLWKKEARGYEETSEVVFSVLSEVNYV